MNEWFDSFILFFLQNYLHFENVVPDDLNEADRKSFIERVFSDQLYHTWAQEVIMHAGKLNPLKSS